MHCTPIRLQHGAATTSTSSARAPVDLDLAAGDRRRRPPSSRPRCSRRRAGASRRARRAGASTRIVDVPSPVDRRRPSPAGTGTARRRAARWRRGGSRCARRRRPRRAAPSRCRSPTPRRGRSTRRVRPVGRLERVPGAVERSRAPIARSACRCVSIVRRAGKSPPGGASRARPRRASSGPSSSTEPRSRPTSAGSGSSVVIVAQRIAQRRRADALDLAPRSSSSRAITSTSRMRGTFVSTHSSSVSRHAASSGSAAFLLPSTVDPARQPLAAFNHQCGHAVQTPRSVAQLARTHRDRRSPRAARRRTARARRARHRSTSARMSAAVAPPSLTMKLACVGDTRAPPCARALEARRDRRARRPSAECRPARGSPAGSGF